MFIKLSKGLYDKVSLKVLIISIIIFIAFMIVVLPMVSDYTMEKIGDYASPDMSFFYSASDLYDMADEYGEDGRNAYILMRFTHDLVWPLVYLFFLAAAITWFLKPLMHKTPLIYLNLLPFIGALFDYLENIGAVIVMARYPSVTPVIAEVTPVFSVIKWSVLGISFVVLFLVIIYRIIRIVKAKVKK